MEFTVIGEPIAKGRPRVTKWGAYTPKKTVDYENRVKTEFGLAGGTLQDGQLKMHIRAYFSIPKSVSKATREKMSGGEIRPVKRPDIDNIGKICMDGLNKIAYADDSQIVRLTVDKFYSDLPRVEIEIKECK